MRQDGPLGLGQDGPGPSCPNPLYDAIVIFGDKVCSCSFQVLMVIKNVEMCTEYNSMLSKQYGCIIIFLVDQS